MRQINLLPDDLQAVETKKIIRNYIVMIFGPLALVIIILHVFLVFRIEALTRQAELPPEQIDSPEINGLRQKVNSLEAEIVTYINNNELVVDTLVKHFPVTDILKLISQATIDKVWLTAFNLNVGGSNCQIEGRSLDTRLVSEFMLELKSLDYFQDVELISMDKNQQAGDEQVDFTIICKFH